MARQAQGPAHGGERRYAPRALGNRTGPAEDRVTVVLRNPTAHDRRDLYAAHPPWTRVGDEFKTDAAGAAAFNRAVVERFVVSVENYIDQNGSPITDGPALAEHGDTAIVVEVADEIVLGLSLGEASGKGYAGSSDSSPAVTSPSPLTVTNAGATAGTVDATADVATRYQDTESSSPVG